MTHDPGIDGGIDRGVDGGDDYDHSEGFDVLPMTFEEEIHHRSMLSLSRALAEKDTEIVRLRQVLDDIHLLALEANEEYESSCRSKVSRIYSLSKKAL